MKERYVIIISLLMFMAMQSCNNKKLTEVVEVPLPTAQEKITIGNPEDVRAETGSFEMIKLPYAYDALVPAIDPMTMEIHYSKHYLTYTNNLNKLVAGTEFEKTPIEDLLKKLDITNADLRNNAGGYYNHTLFWESIAPKSGGEPKDTLAAAIKRDFGSYDNFKIKFETVAEKQFGSGWAWLITDKAGKLQVTATANQDNPLMPNAAIPGTPILALDVWEHAYYLNYQYKRKKYIESFFTIIDWKKTEKRYFEAIKN